MQYISVVVRVSAVGCLREMFFNTDSMLLDKVKWVELNIIDGAC